MRMIWLIVLIVLTINSNLSAEENAYDRFFLKQSKSDYNDTMFERVLWHKKVSFLVLETINNGFFVTMMVIPESPYNFKGTTYPLHYFFSSYEDAFKKIIWLDSFLKKKGILKVSISGSLITNERIMNSGSN